MEKKKLYIIILLIFFILSCLIHSGLLFDGYIINADFTRVDDLESFVEDFSPVWNERGSYSNVFRLSKILIYSPLFFLNIFGLNFTITPVFFIYFTILSTISSFSVFLLCDYLLSNRYTKLNSNYKNMIYFASGFFYIFSTYIVQHVTHPTIRYGFYLSPLILYTTIRGINEQKRIYLIITVFLWSLACSDMHWVFFGTLLIFGYALFSFIIKIINNSENRSYILEDFLKNCFLIFALFISFNSYWILPGLISGGTSLYGNVLTQDNIQVFFRNANLNNIVAMKANFNLQESYGEIPGFLNFLNLNLFLVVLTSLGILSFVLIKNKTKEYIFILFIFIISLFLSAGPNLFKNLFFWFMFDAPYNDFYNWVFRTPKSHQFIILSIAILIAFSGSEILYKIRNKYLKQKFFVSGFLILILVCSTIPNYPILTGDFNDNLETVEIPEEYEKTILYLDDNSKESKTVWAPPFNGLYSNWNKNKMGDFTNDISENPTFDNTFFNDNFIYPLVFGMRFPYNSIVYENKTCYLADFLKPLNISHISIHNDVPILKSKIEILIEKLLTQKGSKLELKNGYISIFKIENSTPKIFIKNTNAIMQGGLAGYNSLTYGKIENISNLGIFYSDSTYDGIDNIPYDIFLLNGEGNLYPFYKNGIIVEPFHFSDRYDPLNCWSKTYINSINFRNFIVNNDLINRYQFDYGKGLILTKSSSKLEELRNLKDEDLIYQNNFEKNFSGWNTNFNQQQKLSLNTNSFEGKYSLQSKLEKSSEGWKIINSPLIKVDHKSKYNIKFNIKGNNIQDAHLKIIEFDKNENILEKKFLKNIGSGDFDWKHFSFTFSLSNYETSSIQIQIWHGYKTNFPLPNEIWLDSVRLYNLSRFLKPNTIKIPFEVKHEDQYELFVRMFKNKNGGKIDIYIDGVIVGRLESKSQLDMFIWKKFGKIFLKEGPHELTVKNKEGLNAINIFSFVPSQKKQEEVDLTYEILNNKSIAFLLEAEYDFYDKKAKFLKTDSSASNGGLACLDFNSKLWKVVTIPDNRNYTFAVRMRGFGNIKIDNKSYFLNSTDLDFSYINVHLNKGSHKIEFSTNRSHSIRWTFEDEDYSDWIKENFVNENYSLELCEESTGNYLKAVLMNPESNWKKINSPLVQIESDKLNNWTFQIKGKDSHKVHVKIVEYDINKSILAVNRIGSIGDGTFDWINYSCEFLPSLNDTRYIQLQIWHGYESNKNRPNVIFLKNVSTNGYSLSEIDVLWIYPSKAPIDINEYFSKNKKPAEILNINRISPSKYSVYVNASSPFMLSFAETYNSGWIANDGSNIYSSIPLYGCINGFWIEKTGNFEMIIEFEPQYWLQVGLIISSSTILIIFFYFICKNKKLIFLNS